MKRLILGLFALSLMASPAFAVATTKSVLANTAWTDLGVGPLLLCFKGASGVYAISDTTPSLVNEGFTMLSGDSVSLKTTSHVWATSRDALGVTAFTAPISP